MGSRSSTQIRSDIKTALRKLGWTIPWVNDVLPELTFTIATSGGGAAATYKGGTVTLGKDTYNGDEIGLAAIPQLIHEIWHGYWDLFAEESRTDRGQKVRAQFLKTEKRMGTASIPNTVQGKYTTHSNPKSPAHSFKQGGIPGLTDTASWFAGDPAKECMANELWGNYIQECLDAANEMKMMCQSPAEAQRIWGLFRAANKVHLADIYIEGGKTYSLKPKIGRFIRVNMLGLTDNVDQWPSGYRGWQQAKYRGAFQTALKASGAETGNGTPGVVIVKFVDALIRRDGRLRTAYAGAKVSTIKAVGPTDKWGVDPASRELRVPSSWAMVYRFNRLRGVSNAKIFYISPLVLKSIRTALGVK